MSKVLTEDFLQAKEAIPCCWCGEPLKLRAFGFRQILDAGDAGVKILWYHPGCLIGAHDSEDPDAPGNRHRGTPYLKAEMAEDDLRVLAYREGNLYYSEGK